MEIHYQFFNLKPDWCYQFRVKKLLKLGFNMNNEEIKKFLKYSYLSPALYIPGYVHNEPLCNYEKYLRELINNSEYFLKLSKGIKYEKPESESHGEADAVSAYYSVDFKLVEATTMIEAQRQFSYSISNLENGVTAIGSSKRTGKTVGTVLHGALRALVSFDEIDEIIDSPNNYIKLKDRTEQQIELICNGDLNRYFKILSTKKNILLYLPYEFFVELEIEDDDIIKCIEEVLFEDFGLSFEYRKKKLCDKDTFLCCIYNNSLIIFKYENNNLIFVDRINLNKSSTYTYLKEKYDSGVF